jgi:hypothetical protein
LTYITIILLYLKNIATHHSFAPHIFPCANSKFVTKVYSHRHFRLAETKEDAEKSRFGCVFGAMRAELWPRRHGKCHATRPSAFSRMGEEQSSGARALAALFNANSELLR